MENIQDVFNFFLINSDPVITGKRKLPKKEIHQLPDEAKNFVIHENYDSILYNSDSEDNTDDDLEKIVKI